MACVSVPAFPLQLLLGRHPEWADLPAAVVERDKPQGLILWANESARRRGVLPGQRYSAGLALASDLRAGEISAAEIAQGVSRLGEQLRRFSPEIEPSAEQPGVFWLDASGLQPLYTSLLEWANRLRDELSLAGFRCAVAVGFTRFGTYAVARELSFTRGERRASVFRHAEDEREAARRVSLRLLNIDPELRDSLEQLGIKTVSAFIRLPPSGIGRRFGGQAQRLHRFASGDLAIPLHPQAVPEPLTREIDLEPVETDVHRLLFLVNRHLRSLLNALSERQEALTEVRIRLKLDLPAGDARRERIERIRTAAPTLDPLQVMNLVHLRLMEGTLPAGVVGIDLAVRSTRDTPNQLQLFNRLSQRDLRAADRALARVRAQFGERSVTRAQLEERHLPEASFTWQPLDHVSRPAPRQAATRPLVRRIYSRPLRLPPRPRNEPDGWLLRGAEHGHVVKFSGPYVVSGGWWGGSVNREYYFARTRDDECVWIYYDRRRRRWFLHGEIG